MSLSANDITVGYDKKTISAGLSLDLPDGRFTAIIGPNACGKSTLLRALSRLLKPQAGVVLLDGRDIHSLPAKDVARRLGLLPQSSIAPDGISVAELVARGRFPHQKLLRQWSVEDEEAVLAAMIATGVSDLSGELVDTLSGGQRQRVWVAMVLAQRPRSCCSTSRPRSSTSPTRSSCWSCACGSTGSRAPRWSRCCTTSTRPPGTPTTWW